VGTAQKYVSLNIRCETLLKMLQLKCAYR